MVLILNAQRYGNPGEYPRRRGKKRGCGRKACIPLKVSRLAPVGSAEGALAAVVVVAAAGAAAARGGQLSRLLIVQVGFGGGEGEAFFDHAGVFKHQVFADFGHEGLRRGEYDFDVLNHRGGVELGEVFHPLAAEGEAQPAQFAQLDAVALLQFVDDAVAHEVERSASVGAVVVLRVTTLQTERVVRRLVMVGMACHSLSPCGCEGFFFFLANLYLKDITVMCFKG